MINVLYISYNGMAEHLSHSQIIPYLKELSGRGFKFTLLSYEKPSALKDRELIRAIRCRFSAMGIEWRYLTYHKRPGLAAKIFDIIMGIIYSTYLVMARRINLIHARSTIPAAIAFIVSRLSGIKYIFDMRGLLAEEYTDASAWKRGSFKYNLVNNVEKRLLASADSIVVLTRKIRKILIEDKKHYPGLHNADIHVIPCCADLDKFRFSPVKDSELLNKMNFGGKFVFAYLGSLGTWYMLDEMADFFKAAKRLIPNAHFLILTQTGKEQIYRVIEKKGLKREDLSATEQPPEMIPRFLSLVDAGIFFIKPSFSKQASSPTKLAEFLACGIPIIINSGVGDTEELVRKEGVGTVIKDFSDQAYRMAIEELKELMLREEHLKRRCRDAAEKHYSLKYGVRQYLDIYEDLLKR